ncbi:Uncharacterised protein [Chlamydia trachomatis]|nr:Uncharacterised protein [Chlamydia trachomatis]
MDSIKDTVSIYSRITENMSLLQRVNDWFSLKILTGSLGTNSLGVSKNMPPNPIYYSKAPQD